LTLLLLLTWLLLSSCQVRHISCLCLLPLLALL
jgi:hypothetical protein